MSVTASTPPRRAGSLRRTTTHDCTRPEGLHGPVFILARGRDLLTAQSGTAEVLADAQLNAHADFATATIEWITAEPSHPGLEAIHGARAFGGFRALVDETMPNERHSGSLRYQLLDDLPIALMLSGRALRVAGLGLNVDSSTRLPIDICAGWANGGTLLAEMTDLGPPLTIGPAAPPLRSDDDILAWHAFDPLAPYGTRRHRRLDVWRVGGDVQVHCFFRDSFADADGAETVVHEYTVRATVDPATLQFLSCHAEAGPLPYLECPSALNSARRIEGLTVAELRRTVRNDFVGPSTCTHLNDTLRSMADIDGLLQLLHSAT
jgi:Protein of unknown function (DUF2889)